MNKWHAQKIDLYKIIFYIVENRNAWCLHQLFPFGDTQNYYKEKAHETFC